MRRGDSTEGSTEQNGETRRPPNHEPPRSTRIVSAITEALGSIPAMVASVLVIVVWAVAGPLFGFSDTWQLVANTFTTLVTFVMVFVIQSAQNRDARAIQTKLDDIVGALKNTDDSLIGLEDLSEHEIREVQKQVRTFANRPD